MTTFNQWSLVLSIPVKLNHQSFFGVTTGLAAKKGFPPLTSVVTTIQPSGHKLPLFQSSESSSRCTITGFASKKASPLYQFVTTFSQCHSSSVPVKGLSVVYNNGLAAKGLPPSISELTCRAKKLNAILLSCCVRCAIVCRELLTFYCTNFKLCIYEHCESSQSFSNTHRKGQCIIIFKFHFFIVVHYCYK